MEFDHSGSYLLPWSLLCNLDSQSLQHRLLLYRKLQFTKKLQLLQVVLVSPFLTIRLPTLPVCPNYSEDCGIVQPWTRVETPHSEGHKL